MKLIGKLLLSPFAILFLFLISCKESPESRLDGTIGLMNFSFDTKNEINDYIFRIITDFEGITDSYIIQNYDSLSKGTAVTNLKANFQPINSLVIVKANEVEQKSSFNENDFTFPVKYEAFAQNGNLKKYKVFVNAAKKRVTTEKYIFINQSTYTETQVQSIVAKFGGQSNKHIAVGIGVIISVLNGEPVNVISTLNTQLALATKYNLPISIKLDAEIWWNYRSDLWNWWDSSKPGFNLENKDNVEWTSWNRDDAVKIGWLNWGRQIRMVPCPNLMSPKYREAVHTELTRNVNAIKAWYNGLSEDKKFLFGGIVLGWESSIGVNVFHYPNGNSFMNLPESKDPTFGKTINELPSRGVQTLGYAAVKTAGIANSGTLTDTMQTEVVRRHLEDLSKTVYDLGIPKELIFTHCGGWVEGETLFNAALNKYSCPGWSFYKYAANPANDSTAMNALAKSDAPYWGAVEWLLQGNKTQAEWASALSRSLAGKSRMLVIYNWNDINANDNALNAIKEINK